MSRQPQVISLAGITLDIDEHINASIALRRCGNEIRQRQGRALEDLLAIGEQLAKARDLLRGAYEQGKVDGEWRRWLQNDVQMERIQAKRFIDVYERYGKGGTTSYPQVTFSVLAELAAPEADPETVVEIEQKIASGERVTVKDVVKAKRKAKPRKRSGDDNPETVKALREREELAALLLAWTQASDGTREHFLALKGDEITVIYRRWKAAA